MGSELATNHSWSLDTPVNQELGYAVCEQIAFGRSLLEIETLPGFPSAALFTVWCMRDPSLSMAATKAREVSSFSFEDEAVNLARATAKRDDLNSTQLKAIDLYINQLRWSATKRNPQVFSEKSAVNMVVPVQINTTLDMGDSNLKQGSAQFPNIYELQATNVVEVGPDHPEVEAQRERKRGRGPTKRQLARMALTPEGAAEAARRAELRAIAADKRRERNRLAMKAKRDAKKKEATGGPSISPSDDVQA